MRLTLITIMLMLANVPALAAELDPELWGSEEQGWEDLTAFELMPDSIVVELNQGGLDLNTQESAEVLREIVKMGPRPDRDAEKEAHFAWNDKLEKDVLKTKFGSTSTVKRNLAMSHTANLPNANEWYDAFLQMRRLRLYEAAGYKVISMDSVAYSDVGWRFYFLLVRE